MYPWQLFWAPVFHFPFGGSVAQRIEPNTNWFFGSIRPEAGDADIEQRAFEIASYGKQIGKITDVLLDIAQRSPPATTVGIQALTDLQHIRERIEGLKLQDLEALAADVEAKILRIRKVDELKAMALQQRLSSPEA